jgi:D-glycero-D-manno-heptose 1,7-bisphosphate phosphatase
LVQTKSGKPFLTHGDQELMPGVKEKIAAHKATGDIITVISNQGGIPKYKSLDSAIAEFQELMQMLPDVSSCYFCPDFGGAECIYLNQEGRVVFVHAHWKKYSHLIGSFRKPHPGMLLLAIEHELRKPVAEDRKPNQEIAEYVGDRPEDEGAAMAAGVPFHWADQWREQP